MATSDQTDAAPAQSWTGRKVHGGDGSKLGKLEHVYLAESTGRPTWGIVKSGRKRHFVPLQDASAEDDAVRVPADRSHVRSAPAVPPDQRLEPDTESRLSEHYASREALADTRERQREAYGGFNIGAAFFGWLVALGMAALLTAILSAAGAAIGLTSVSDQEARSGADAIGIVGGALLLLVLVLAYLAGGYVAGRMSRFDGARQGAGVWVFGLAVTILLAVLGLVFGSEYNVLEQLNLPRIPVDEGSLATGGVIALAAILIGTLVGAVLGGKLGERYHRKVDRAGHAT